MNKVRSSILYGLIGAGMIYALMTLAATPVAACTPTQCDSISQVAGIDCFAQFGGDCTVGIVASCDASGVTIDCYTSNQSQFCGPIVSQCQ